ncbi:MAG TPA: glycerol kinase GlpK [Rubricoccaceae bacterium]|jgi:glycerol kinase
MSPIPTGGSAPLLLALDAGTTSTRAVLFGLDGTILATAQRPLSQHYPRPGLVEHDAAEIRDAAVAVARECLDGIDARRVAALGIANQRETTVVWDRATGAPVGPAIVWQDRRTADTCARLAADGLGPHVEATTGLRLDPYFSATKLAWILDHTPGAREAAARGDLAFGTVDAWLVWSLTGGPHGGVHATDVTNASRTMLWSLREARWDDELLAALDIPRSVLPDVRPSAGDFGTTRADLFGAALPIRGVAGDQHAALVGQACLAPGQTKTTLGTGAFLLMHTGQTPARSAHGLLTTVAYDLGDGPQFALEGSIFVAGAAVQWLRDELGVVETADETAALAASVPDTGGVVFVPAFTGLGAPVWDPAARGLIAGLTRGTTRAHLVRAALEAVAFQTRGVVDAMAADAGLALPTLRVDGGAAANPTLLQMLADALGAPVERPALVEATAWGAAALAGIASGLLTPTEVAAGWSADVRVTPDPASRLRTDGYRDWQRAVALATGWAAR